MRARTIAFALALCLAAAAAAQEPKYQVAVSPFANAGADKSADYIGFQASEFISNAMAGFAGVQVVERGQLMRILEEQELQLSGVTETGKGASVGQILNAKQIVLGSFELGAAKLSLNARLVDVSTGAVLSRAQLEAPRSDSYAPAYKALLFQLLSGLPEYKLTIGVEARIESYGGQAASAGAAQAADDYAKALAALYKKDDAAALDYLQKAVGSADVGFLGFGDAADRYVETLTKAKGASRYAKMVQRQVETNKALMEQVEPLSIYRATLKLLSSRAASIVGAEAFEIKSKPADAVQFNDGAVSSRVVLPAEVEIGLKPGARAALDALFAGQEVARLGSSGVSLAPLPQGSLLSDAALRGLLSFRLSASLAHAIQFLNAKGEVVYELRSDPAPVLRLDGASAAYSVKARPSYVPAAYREGWALREDGSLEVQARALADLDTVRYVIRPESLARENSIGVDSDLVWRSLVSHAYRKRSIKVASQLDDPAPQFKEVVVTDSFYETNDPELGRVPILPRNGRVAGFAALTAVVYVADSAKDAVNLSWSGAVTGQSKPFVGELGPNSILYFDSPERYYIRYGDLAVTARLGQAQAGKTATVRLAGGASWAIQEGFRVAADEDRFYTNSRAAFALNGERLPWKPNADCNRVLVADDAVYALRDYGLQRLDKKSGALLGQAEGGPYQGISQAALENGKLFLMGNNLGIEALDAASGRRLWKTDDRGGSFALARGRLYSASGRVYDAATGAMLFNTEGNGAPAAADGRIYYINGVCADLETGKTLWKAPRNLSLGAPIPSGAIVYFGGGAALAARDGSALWVNANANDDAILSSGRLYVEGCRVLDAESGRTIWKTANACGLPFRVDDFLYANYDGFSRLDLSVLEVELDADALASRGRFDAPIADSLVYKDRERSGVLVQDLVAGSAAAAAGLRPGDVVMKVDGRRIRSAGELADLVLSYKGGDRVRLGVERYDPAGQQWAEIELAMKLGAQGEPKAAGARRLGLLLAPFGEERARALRLENGNLRGLEVVDVVKASPAAASGFLPGDIILALGDRRFYDFYNWDERVAIASSLIAARPRAGIDAVVWRAGAELRFKAYKP